MDQDFFKKSNGVTLIELLIALVISAILVAGIYRTFIHQQRGYATQEQIADMQQNVRVAINRMIREIRMAGFGGKNENTNGKNDIITAFGNVNGFVNIINAVDNSPRADNVGNSDEVTVVGAFERQGRLDQNANAGDATIAIIYDDAGKKFDTGVRKYLCINGRDNYEVTAEAGNVLTIKPSLRRPYTVRDGSGALIQPETFVFLVRAIQYGLRVDAKGIPVLFRDQNTGGGRQTVAEYIEDLQFRYVLADTTEVDVPGSPQDVRGVRITIQARTRMSDPQLKDGVGFHKRTLNTYVDLRNLRD
jgi:prepilin-type N-terminal cleavage/methylation domain-containing protein